jgi:hypothetical protein
MREREAERLGLELEEERYMVCILDRTSTGGYDACEMDCEHGCSHDIEGAEKDG